MSDDTISRKAAIDALVELYEYQRDIDPTEAADLVRQGVYLAEKKIEQLPSVQLDIVRCKDCKHWSRESICDGFCSEDCMRHDEDFYCGYAERKTNE